MRARRRDVRREQHCTSTSRSGADFLRREVGAIRAVDDVSIDIGKGETFGLVGESGSGKSTLGRVMLALDEPSSGQVLFKGTDLATLNAAKNCAAFGSRCRSSFRIPYASLNPRMRVGKIIREPLDIHNDLVHRRTRDARVRDLLEMVGLDARHTPAGFHMSSPAVSGSALASPARWRPNRRLSWRTNRYRHSMCRSRRRS